MKWYNRNMVWMCERRRRAHVRLVGLLLVLGTVACGQVATAAEHQGGRGVLVFGFLPIESPERLARRFDPLVDYVRSALGVPVRFESARNFSEFVRRTEIEQRYDLLFTAPHFYYTAQRNAGYRVVARVDATRLKAVIVARKDGPIQQIQDLRGKSLATPDRRALGTLLIRRRLMDAGLSPGLDVTVFATPSHNASLTSVVQRRSDAAGLMEIPFYRSAPAIRNQVRIIAETDSTLHMPFSVHERLPRELTDRFSEVLIDMRMSENGRRLLHHLGWPGFTGAVPKDYDSMRRFVASAT